MTPFVPLKRVAAVTPGQSPSSDVVTDLDGDLPFLQGNAEFGELFPDPRLSCAVAPKRCRAGDILLSVRAPVGALNIADREYGIGRGLCAVRPLLVDSRYLWWTLHASTWRLHSAAVGSTYDAVTAYDVAGLPIPYPSADRQVLIADFLDRATTRVDALVLAERTRLAVAQERLATEVQAQVLGRVDLFQRRNDAEGPLEPIPVGWIVRRNKTFLQEIVELSASGDEELLTVSHITGVTPRSEKDVTMFLAESNAGYKRVRPDDLIINTMWAWMGALGVSAHEGIVSPAYGVYRFTESGVDPGYFDALFRSGAYVAQMTRYSKGVWSSRLRLYPDSFLALRSPFPPIQDQLKIAARVRELRRETDRLSELLQSSLGLLRERRQALIIAAITGQINIPGASAA